MSNPFIVRMKWLILDQLRRRFLFWTPWREQAGRQEFFYNAFRTLAFNRIDGDYAEFGSWGAMTFGLAYHEARRHRHGAKLWAFDSFQGLPAPDGARDEHPVWQAGGMAMSLEAFHARCAAQGVPRDAYSVVPGFYADTLTGQHAQDPPRNIALAYVDCDLYSSANAVLQFLKPRLKHGMIVAFDDYFCYSATQVSGERRAMLEVLGNDPQWTLVPYRSFGWHGTSFVVEDRKILDG
jgi:hypothetical protein